MRKTGVRFGKPFRILVTLRGYVNHGAIVALAAVAPIQDLNFHAE